MKLGNQCKQQWKSKQVLHLLNRLKQAFDWDNGAPDKDDGLIEADHPTNNIPPEMSGFALESDQDSPNHEPKLHELDLIAAATENANLTNPLPDSEIAGVYDPPFNHHAHTTTDNEGGHYDDDDEGDDNDEDDLDIIALETA